MQLLKHHDFRHIPEVDASLRATILGSLKKFNEELGISIARITHDLTTAYQICKNIIVLYKGRVAEAGPVEKVIKDPKHPCTQLLVPSIPLQNIDTPWGGGHRVTTQTADSTTKECFLRLVALQRWISGKNKSLIVFGTMLVEVVFSYPSLGLILFQAIVRRDYAVIQGISLMLILALGFTLFIIDLVYPMVDPRIRFKR